MQCRFEALRFVEIFQQIQMLEYVELKIRYGAKIIVRIEPRLLPIGKRANPASFYLFLFFSHDNYTNTTNDKSIDGVLGTWIWGGRMVGADESTELWRHPE